VALLYRCSDEITCYVLLRRGVYCSFILFYALGGGLGYVATRVSSGCDVVTRCARERYS
jgi:hypothetical protein